MTDWQPIETAPRDSTRIIGWDGANWSITYYQDGRVWVNESEVTSDGYGWYGHDNWKPTQWTPLPKPPIRLPRPCLAGQGKGPFRVVLGFRRPEIPHNDLEQRIADPHGVDTEEN